MSTKIIENQDKIEIPVSDCCIVINCDTREDAIVYTKAYQYKEAMEEVWQRLFRPRHKHGYNVKKINDLLKLYEESVQGEADPCNDLMDELEKIYHEIMGDLNE